MTTAHVNSAMNAVARGGENDQAGNRKVAPTFKVSARDLPGHKKLKFRQIGQGTRAEFEEKADKGFNFRDDLERRERAAKEDKSDGKPAASAVKRKVEYVNPFPEDADDDPNEDKSDSEKEEESAEEEDDEDDTEELMRELAKIKKEREEEEAKRKQEEERLAKRSQKEEVLKGNPLLMGGQEVSLSRKWDDDTVFKNQAKTAPKAKARYINDAVRSDFHRKFLSKYMIM